MAANPKQITTMDLMVKAMGQVRIWEAGQRDGLVCPVCGAPGLEIIDRSARPHMSWYALSCGSCGLDEAIALPETAHGSAID